MDRHITLPGFPTVEVYFDRECDGEITVVYFGWPADLVAAGVVTEQMLAPRVWMKRDADGHRFRLRPYFRLRDGRPERYYRVDRIKLVEQIDRLPGAKAARAANERWVAWVEAGRREEQDVRCPHLRLVVDNSKKVSHGQA